jgi:hypothetical protein
VAALERALGLAVARVEDDPAEREPAAEGEEVLARAAVGSDRTSRSQTSLSGRAPSRARQRAIPKAMSGNSFENTSAPAKARE